jgi:LysR family transcriptional activator of nhaA
MFNYKHLYYFHAVARAGAVNRAAEKLHLTPQTLSGQLAAFETRLGAPLFRRSGRRLELTEFGQTVLGYADDIFQIGNELEDVLAQRGGEIVAPFRVGVVDVVPKAIAHQLLAPALAVPVKLVCREGRLDDLAADLALHRLDMVLADRPLPSTVDIKGYSHPLGECGVAFLATAALAAQCSGAFPQCLHAQPLLIPGAHSAVHTPLLRWFERLAVSPHTVGEFDDSALMLAFGQAGVGVFPVPDASAAKLCAQQGLVKVGQTDAVRERFFAISVERRLSHPAVVAVSEAARQRLLGDAVATKPPTTPQP